MTTRDTSPALALTSHVIGRAVLAECVALLEPEQIRVMPLKGLWLQELVYGEAQRERAITDVDVLVEPGCYRAAQRVLARAGWQREVWNVSEACYAPPGRLLPVDLHARLFTRGVFRMPPAQLFARGRADRAVFGVPVVLPDPVDVMAHLIGHALKGGTAWAGQGQELHDIPRIAERFQLAPEHCAARFDQLGIARAARLVLPLMAADFAGAVLAALAPDPLGDRLAQAAQLLRVRLPEVRPLPTLTGFALDSSLWRGSAALLLRAADKVAESVHLGASNHADR